MQELVGALLRKNNRPWEASVNWLTGKYPVQDTLCLVVSVKRLETWENLASWRISLLWDGKIRTFSTTLPISYMFDIVSLPEENET